MWKCRIGIYLWLWVYSSILSSNTDTCSAKKKCVRVNESDLYNLMRTRSLRCAESNIEIIKMKTRNSGYGTWNSNTILISETVNLNNEHELFSTSENVMIHDWSCVACIIPRNLCSHLLICIHINFFWFTASPQSCMGLWVSKQSLRENSIGRRWSDESSKFACMPYILRRHSRHTLAETKRFG